jgi:hypothetical protein
MLKDEIEKKKFNYTIKLKNIYQLKEYRSKFKQKINFSFYWRVIEKKNQFNKRTPKN